MNKRNIEKKIKKEANFNNKIKKILEKESKKSLCLKKQVSAVVVKNNKIIGKGYNGNSKNIPPCSVIGCAKNYFKYRPGQKNQLCTGICAEQRAMMNAYKKKNLKGSKLYTTHKPCYSCVRYMIELGIKECYYIEDYNDIFAKQLIKLGNIKCEKF